MLRQSEMINGITPDEYHRRQREKRRVARRERARIARAEYRLASEAKRQAGIPIGRRYFEKVTKSEPRGELAVPRGIQIEEREGQKIAVHHREIFERNRWQVMRIALPFVSIQFGA